MRGGGQRLSQQSAFILLQHVAEEVGEAGVKQTTQEEVDGLGRKLESELEDWFSEGTPLHTHRAIRTNHTHQ